MNGETRLTVISQSMFVQQLVVFFARLDECRGKAAIKTAEQVFKQLNRKGVSHIKEAVVKVVKVRLLHYLNYGLSITSVLPYCLMI